MEGGKRYDYALCTDIEWGRTFDDSGNLTLRLMALSI